jgi:hypothetical protein
MEGRSGGSKKGSRGVGRMQEAPVLTTFDPRFNMRKAMWFEKLYQPFLGAFRQQRIDTDDEELPLDSFYLEP